MTEGLDADVLFIQCIRAHIESGAESCQSGLLRAIFDKQIGVALKSMDYRGRIHGRSHRRSGASGKSRSALAVCFKELFGETPLEYLATWRMNKAAALLQEGDKKLFGVAKSGGYSEVNDTLRLAIAAPEPGAAL